MVSRKNAGRWTLDTVEWMDIQGHGTRDTLDWTYKGSDGSVCASACLCLVSVSICDSLIPLVLRNLETLIHRGTLRRSLYREGGGGGGGGGGKKGSQRQS